MHLLKLSLLCFVCIRSMFCEVLDFSSDFDAKIVNTGVSLVKFFAPWCGHCKSIAPHFSSASNSLPSGSMIEVDCTTDSGRGACEKHNVAGYPTLKLFRNGKFVEDYQGGRDTKDFITYIEQKSLPVIVEITSVEEFMKKIDSKHDLKGIAFGFFEKSDDKMLAAFKQTADFEFTKMHFAYSVDSNVFQESGHKNQIVYYLPAIIRSPRLESSEYVYSGSDNSQDIIKFLHENQPGLCGIRHPDNMNEFDDTTVVAYMNLDVQKNAKAILYVRNRLLKAANKLTESYSSLKFAISDSDQFSRELHDAGIETDKSKAFIIIYDKSGQKFKMTTAFTSDSVIYFTTKVMKGEIEPLMKSEEIPSSSIENGVHVAVAKNFNDVVIKSDKDVLIEFYATWCGHCKSLAPVLTSVAEKLEKSGDNVIIVKMNAADNDVIKPFEVQGFPTMYFLPKNDKKNPIKYSGGRTVEDFMSYFAKHSTDPLVGYNRDGTKISEKEL